MRPGFADFAESEAEACCGVAARTSSKSRRNSRTCARVMMKGGSRRNVKSWVQLMSKPRCMASLTKGPPSTESSTPIIRPSANFADEAEFCSKFREAIAQLRTSRADILEELFFLDDLEKFQGH